MTELDEEPSILVENCFEVRGTGELVAFPSFTEQRDMFLTSDVIMSILDPSPELVKLYSSK